MIDGLAQLERKMKELDIKVQRKICRAALGKGAAVIAKAVQGEAPGGGPAERDKSTGRFTRAVKGSKTQGQTKKSIGRRVRNIGGVLVAKIGVNVGKKKSRQKPHSHLVVLGTAPRYTASGNKKAYRGKMPANPFVRKGTSKSSGQAVRVAIEYISSRIKAEAAK